MIWGRKIRSSIPDEGQPWAGEGQGGIAESEIFSRRQSDLNETLSDNNNRKIENKEIGTHSGPVVAELGQLSSTGRWGRSGRFGFHGPPGFSGNKLC
jgi:hypothetical protein